MLDRLGLVHDITTRISKVRQYAAEKIAIARDAIYRLALPIRGAAVERLLFEFSGVPTVVCV